MQRSKAHLRYAKVHLEDVRLSRRHLFPSQRNPKSIPDIRNDRTQFGVDWWMVLLATITTVDAFAKDKHRKLLQDGLDRRQCEGVPAVRPLISVDHYLHNRCEHLINLNPVGIFHSMNGLVSQLNERTFH